MPTTRSGRQSKKPVRYEPEEIPVDDYDDGSSDEEDIDLSGSESDFSSESDDEDADANGNLKDFVVDDEDECDI
tara:strand:+ start:201 stop:422 length:222 start_codon:yes stop_codon:yes gene_type:complete